MSDFIKNISNAYEVIKEEHLEGVKADGVYLKHKKTGARVALVINDDKNKVFQIGFRTPPTDDTGVPHIIEHTVLCGSKKYPVKDPFIELAKGSLNTFLNAITYPDKTIYPIASCNDKDFKNLMDVYLDAVFNPNIYIHEEIFKQEGWHYEIESPEDPIVVNGIVYNEMKGAYSSAEEVLDSYIRRVLYPNTTYSKDSGGAPEAIPTLSYNKYLDFHRKYYHPSNSYIYLYGNADMAERLDYIDKEYLSKYDFLKVDSEIDIEKPFAKMQEETFEYSSSDDSEGHAYLSFSTALNGSGDEKFAATMNILDYVLMSSPGAIVKKALADAEIGADVYGTFTGEIKQPFYSFVAVNAKEEDKQRFYDVIMETLRDICAGGIPTRTLEAAINVFEFNFREGDFGRYPKGLLLGIRILKSWLYYEDKPFDMLKMDEAFKFLREQLGTDYFVDAIKKFFVENPHAALVTLAPKAGLEEAKAAELAAKMAEFKRGLSEEEVNKLIEDTKALRRYQEEPSKQEDLEKIPLLSIDDLEKTVEPPVNEEITINGFKGLWHDLEPNGIVYEKLVFKLDGFNEEELQYAGLLSEVFCNMDTENYSYSELNDEINFQTGGIAGGTEIHGSLDTLKATATFEIPAKAFMHKCKEMNELLAEVMFRADYSDLKRLKEIISKVRVRLKMSLASSGNATAEVQAKSAYSMSAYLKDILLNVSYLRFIEDIDNNFSEKGSEIVDKLNDISKEIFSKERLLIDIIGREESVKAITDSIGIVLKGLNDSDNRCHSLNFVPGKKRTAFITDGAVQYNALCSNYKSKGFDYNGGLKVLRTILSYDYLWNNIRVKGGAYGCSGAFEFMGSMNLSSYRDPHLNETYEVYEKIADYIENFNVSDRDMTKFIIGTVSTEDIPLTILMNGSRSLNMYLSDVPHEFMQKSRDELLATDVKSIRAFAPLIREALSDYSLCVVGTESKINACKDKFDKIEMLAK